MAARGPSNTKTIGDRTLSSPAPARVSLDIRRWTGWITLALVCSTTGVALHAVMLGGQAVVVKPCMDITPTTGGFNGSCLPLSSVCVGDDLVLELWVTSTIAGSPGIAGGTVNVQYSAGTLEAGSIVHGPLFEEFPTGSIDPLAGRIVDLGGNTLQSGVGTAPDWALLARVFFRAANPGNALLTVGAGGFPFALSGGQPPLNFDTDVVFQPLSGFQIAPIGLVGDGDCNGAVDLADYANLAGCVTGPGGIEAPRCQRFDIDLDGDVDLLDMARFVALLTR